MIHPPVLLYHRISPRPLLAGTWVTPVALAIHLDRILSAGFRALSATEWLRADGVQRDRSFLITFDDGTEDLFLYREILRERAVPGVVFVPAALVGERNRWELALPTRRTGHLQPAQLRDLVTQTPGWEAGLHGDTHRDLTRLTDAELWDELHGGRCRLAELIGQQVRLVSYPFGRVNRRVADTASRAGFRAGFVVSRHASGVPPAFAIRRRPVYCIDTPAAVVTKVRDPRGRSLRGRWELAKEGAVHAVGHWAAACWRPTGPAQLSE